MLATNTELGTKTGGWSEGAVVGRDSTVIAGQDVSANITHDNSEISMSLEVPHSVVMNVSARELAGVCQQVAESEDSKEGSSVESQIEKARDAAASNDAQQLKSSLLKFGKKAIKLAARYGGYLTVAVIEYLRRDEE